MDDADPAALHGVKLFVPAAAYFVQSAASTLLVGAEIVAVTVAVAGLVDVLPH